jgi:hypothetical protein
MNDAEKYLFDLNGYLVIENVLTPEEVARAACSTGRTPGASHSGRCWPTRGSSLT